MFEYLRAESGLKEYIRSVFYIRKASASQQMLFKSQA